MIGGILHYSEPRLAGTSRLRLAVIAMLIVLLVITTAGILEAQKIYVNTAAIDARTDLTDAQKQAVKTALTTEIKRNLDQAWGECKTEILTAAEGADRTVEIDGTTPGNRRWGLWQNGSSSTTVYLRNYMDRDDNRFKDAEGNWDTAQLGTALGTTAAHEIAHSYSVGHDDTNTNKMNTGNSAAQIGGGLNFNEAARTTLVNNRANPPCNPSAKSTEVACIAKFYNDPVVYAPYAELHESGSITTTFDYNGPMASMFDFGWWGTDTDNGAVDGNPYGDFIYKSSMTGTEADAPAITYFDGWTVNFVLRGREDTPYVGQHFQISPENMNLTNPVVRPDGVEVFRDIMLSWQLDTTNPEDDVVVYMSADIYGPDNQMFSGFRLGYPGPVSIARNKQEIDGRIVRLGDAVVTGTFSEFFYVASRDRSSGIRINWPGDLPQESRRVIVEGKIATAPSGERQIDAMSVQLLGPEDIRPLGMSLRSVGGGDFEYIPVRWASGQKGFPGRSGLNTIGLPIRVFGKFEYVDEFSFMVDDGSGESIKCIAPHGDIMIDPFWTYVAVTGICSSEETDNGLRPVILISESGDITPYEQW